jgi:L,D-transpeptidase-like protein/putative peptidoglycan binding protein
VRQRAFLIIASVLAVLFVGVGAIYAYDKSREDDVTEGISVSGIPIGGMSEKQARQRLQEELTARLNQPVVARYKGQRFRLKAITAQIRFDINGMVDEAIDRSREGSIFARTVRNVRGSNIDEDLPVQVSYSKPAVDRFVRRVARGIDRKPQNAEIDFQAAVLGRVQEVWGRKTDRARLRREVTGAIEQQRFGTVRALVRRVRPRVTKADLARQYPVVLTIDRGGFTLRLFRNLNLARTYPIAVGSQGYSTPGGLYSIENKQIDPAWSVPNEAWAGALAGSVVPGGAPDNPLKSRWLGFGGGRGIHGTADDASIGSAASHGCIRMHVGDVEELYDQVPTGAPLFIV